MKRMLMIVGCLGVLIAAGSALADGTMQKKAMPAKAMKPAMSLFLIESPHTPEECMRVMDEAKHSKDIEAWSWGCEAGNHTAYRMVHAADEAAALAMVPEDVRGKAHAYKLTKMTAAKMQMEHKHGM